jgi:chromosome segregation ATPase
VGSDDSRLGSKVVMKERMKRGEEKLAGVKASLSEERRKSDMLASKMKEKERELALLLVEHSDHRGALEEIVAALRAQLSKADEWGDQASDAQEIMVRMGLERDTLNAVVDGLKGELAVLKRDRGENIMKGEDASIRLVRAEKELAASKTGADRVNRDLISIRSELSGLAILYEDSQLLGNTSAMKLKAAQKAVGELQEEVLIKGEALEEASRALVMMKNERGFKGETGGETKPSSELMALRRKIGDHEEEKRKWQAEQRDLLRKQGSSTTMFQANAERQAGEQQYRVELEQALEEKNEALLGMESEWRRSKEEVERFIIDLKGREEVCEGLQAALDQSDEELKKGKETSEIMGSEIRLLSRRLNEMQGSYSEVSDQVKEAREGMMRTGERLARADKEITLLADNLNQCQRERDREEENGSRLQKMLDAAGRRAQTERADLARAIGEKEVRLLLVSR